MRWSWPRSTPKPNFRAISERAAAIAITAAPATAPDRLAALGVTVLAALAAFADPRTLKVGAQTIWAGQFVLATGSRAMVPALPGLDQIAYFTSDSIADNGRKLSHLLVIGGNRSAFELAQAHARLGADVTLVPQGPVLAGFDPEMVVVLLRALREEGVEILEGVSVAAILPRAQGTGIAIAHADGRLATLDISHVLVTFGRVPDLDPALLGPARLNRDRLRPDHLLVSPDGRTSNRHIVAIGGTAGAFESQYARRQAGVVLQRASGEAGAHLEPLRIAHTVNTMPALAQIGVIDTGAPLRAGQTVLRANAGGAVLGQSAGEVVAMLAMALDRGMGVADLAGLLLPLASPAAPLVDLAQQSMAQQRPSPWARRWAAIAQLWP
ncbi:MAG: FAD-dependent oxidoreductase [Candidatus Devosia euplotis]|nr:FAD-dependent oxidoreductase [Candidatus Devosia euplotis]